MTNNDNLSSNDSSLNVENNQTHKRRSDGGEILGSSKRSRTINTVSCSNNYLNGTSSGRTPISIIPKKSPSDPNSYRVIQLSSGLTVLLISREDPPDDNGIPLSNLRYSQYSPHTNWSFFNESQPKFNFIEPEAFPPAYKSPTSGVDVNVFDCGDPSATQGQTSQNNKFGPATTSSVAAVVNIGGVDDPLNCQGLAHFTEHMVHYGTRKFPKEDAVDILVSNFGTHNAFTQLHTTSYYNQVPDLILEKNLEIFADMLSQPLLKLDVLNREVNAIDNEFYLRLPFLRKFQLLTQVCIQGSTHPLRRFICGSLDTLGEGEEGSRVQRAMTKLHKNNYVSSATTLAINSTKSLDELEELAVRHFSNFQLGDRTIYSKTFGENDTQPVVPQKGTQHVYLEGLTSKAELSLIWCLPTSKNDPDGLAMTLIHRILSDTSESSLDFHLRSQELIVSIHPGILPSRYATLFAIEFWLSEKGCKNVDDVVKTTFDYLHFLNNDTNERSVRTLFDQMRVQKLKEFRYGSSRASLDTTIEMATRLQYVDEVSKLLALDSWEDAKFNFEEVKNVLDLLEEQNVTILETLPKGAKLENKGAVQTAPYTKAKFVVAQWKGRVGSRTNGARHNFILRENRYLEKISGINNNNDGSGDASYLRCPINYGDIEGKRLSWKSPHDHVITPQLVIPKITGRHNGHKGISPNPLRGTLHVQFISAMSHKLTPINFALSYLWGYALHQTTAALQSELFFAGFHVELYPGPSLQLTIRGFPLYIDEAMNSLISQVFEKPITPKVFSLAKQQLTATWETVLFENHAVADLVLKNTMFENSDLSINFLDVLEELTLDDLNLHIIASRQSTMSIVNLIGNLPVEVFDTVATHLDKMPFVPTVNPIPFLNSSNFMPVKPAFFNPGETCVRVKNMSSVSYTTLVSNSYVLGPYGTDQRQAYLFSIAMFFMGCQAFMDLRTKQQLGYVVSVKKYNWNVRIPVLMFSVTVVATAKKFTVCELNQKIDQFLADYSKYMRNIDPEVFQTMQKLKGVPNEITRHDVADWFEECFSKDFGKVDIEWKCVSGGMKKQSIQILTGNEDAKTKGCKCKICSSIGDSDWEAGAKSGSQFLFAKGKGITKDYFVPPSQF